MGKKGGEKKGAGRGSKGQQKAGETSAKPADGPAIKVKSGALNISQKNAARIRDLLLQEAEAPRRDSQARKRSAEELGIVYNDLVGYAFQHTDIQAALSAVQGSCLPDALDWLCMHVPPERLPHRFAAGARSHKAEAVTGMKAATESTVAKKSDAEKKQEKEKQRAELEALRQRSAAAAKGKKAEEAAREQTNKANIVAQYGQYDEVSESESDSAQSVVEDWELWGDPREVERRRAERSRAAQLNMLSPEDCQMQLAQELKTAMDSAKQAKASGNKKQKEVAGEVIRHIKLEISSLGIKEAVIHKLIAEHFKSDSNINKKSTPVQEDASEFPAIATSEPPAAVAEVPESWDAAAAEDRAGGPARSPAATNGACAAHQPAAALDAVSGTEAAELELNALTDVKADAAAAWAAAGAADDEEVALQGNEEEFDPNVLWDDDDTACGLETAEASTDETGAGLPKVPLRHRPAKPGPAAKQLPVRSCPSLPPERLNPQDSVSCLQNSQGSTHLPDTDCCYRVHLQ